MEMKKEYEKYLLMLECYKGKQHPVVNNYPLNPFGFISSIGSIDTSLNQLEKGFDDEFKTKINNRIEFSIFKMNFLYGIIPFNLIDEKDSDFFQIFKTRDLLVEFNKSYKKGEIEEARKHLLKMANLDKNNTYRLKIQDKFEKMSGTSLKDFGGKIPRGQYSEMIYSIEEKIFS